MMNLNWLIEALRDELVVLINEDKDVQMNGLREVIQRIVFTLTDDPDDVGRC